MTMLAHRTQHSETRHHATVVKIPGYELTIVPDGGRVIAKAAVTPAGGAQREAIRCTTCIHLMGQDLPSTGKVCTCRLHHWRKPDGRVLWLTPHRLLSAIGPIARTAERCLDHAPQGDD